MNKKVLLLAIVGVGLTIWYVHHHQMKKYFPVKYNPKDPGADM